MVKPTGYDEVSVDDFTPAELGGHHIIIKGVREEKSSTGKDMLVVAFDFAKNDKQPTYFGDMFDKDIRPDKKWPFQGTQYINVLDNRTGNCSRNFKSFCTCVERSNPGFTIDWDAKDFGAQFKGKMIGGVFGKVEDEYNGKTSLRVRLRWFTDYKTAGNAKVPETRFLPTNTPASAPAPVPAPEDEDLPF